MTGSGPRGPSSEGSRERLVEATRELLWKLGHSSPSPADIRVRRCRAGKHVPPFPTKINLATEAVQRNSVALEGALATLLDEATSPRDGVRSYLNKPRDGQKGCRFGRMTLNNAVLEEDRLHTPVANSLTWYRRRIERLLVDNRQAGKRRNDFSAEAVAATIVAIVQGAYVLARADRSRDSFDRIIEGGLVLLSGLESRT
ncbi:hypothetical protein ABZ599_39775 [Streptomyces misionensis]|uniref:TetR/AcrR family transcriptional regulator n=1 Tax=Streptomyces misionensis TaxID=67331 RepID=UPI0033D2FF42